MYKLVGTNENSFDSNGKCIVKKLPWKTYEEYDGVYDTAETIYRDDFLSITDLDPSDFEGEFIFTYISDVAIAFNMEDGVHYFYMEKGGHNMSVSDDLKDMAIEYYGGEKKDWKRISKKKTITGCYVRVYENTEIDSIVYFLCNDKANKFEYYYHNLPTAFIICLPSGISKENVDEEARYYKIYSEKTDENSDDYDEDYGEEENLPYVMFNTGNPDEEDEISDQHVGSYIEEAYGIKMFRDFDETMENTNLLKIDLSLKEMKDLFVSKGLKFLGYEESDF